MLIPASVPAQTNHGDSDRFKGADLESGDWAMLRKWGKRATNRFHRFYISSQDPKCLWENRSSGRIIIKGWKEEMGKVYKKESMNQKNKKNFLNMEEEINDLHVLALVLWIFIICHPVFWCLRVVAMWSGYGKAKRRFRVRMQPGDCRLWLRDMCCAEIRDLWRRGFCSRVRDQAWSLGAFCVMEFY